LIPVVTGLIAVAGAAVYAIMRYSYQQFYDQFGLPPDDVGPSSTAALTQSGIRVATFVTLFALLPLALGLLVSSGIARAFEEDFARLVRSLEREPRAASSRVRRRVVIPSRLLLDLFLPVIGALVVYRLFTLTTSGSRELNEQVVLAIAVLCLTGKRYAQRAGVPDRRHQTPLRKKRRAVSVLGVAHRIPNAGWIVAALLIAGGALVLGGSLPRDAKKTAGCVISRDEPVRWIHTHRTFFGIASLSHMAVLQVRADPSQMLLAGKLSPENLPRPIGDRPPLVYLGSANRRDFIYDREDRQTLQVPDGSVVLVTTPGPHCHWWEKG
jgi:hypothetical protein